MNSWAFEYMNTNIYMCLFIENIYMYIVTEASVQRKNRYLAFENHGIGSPAEKKIVHVYTYISYV